MHELPQHGKPTRLVYASARMPSRWVEYAYYLSLVYSILGDVFGLSVPMLAGGMILVLSSFCMLQFRSCAKTVYAPIALLLACAASYLSVQIVIHGESVTGESAREFIIWILSLIIVQSLGLRRGFLDRCTVVLFVIGLMALPYLATGGYERATIDAPVSGHLANANGLAGWFGFCAVYFAIFGLEKKRGIVRIGSWLVAIGCLFIVALTVSRGAIFATAIAITVGFRGLLRRGFIPVLVLIILAGVIYETGLFEQAISQYAQRGMEESGRELIWPDGIERFFNSLLVGVGASNVGTYVGGGSVPSPPHNSFLYLALSSGVVPLAFYIAFWIQAAWRSFSHAEGLEYGSFRIPFLLYAFVILMLGDLTIVPWALVALSVGAGRGTSYRTDRLLVVRRIGGRRIIQLLARRSDAVNSIARYRF